jgi:hypothetical protein
MVFPLFSLSGLTPYSARLDARDHLPFHPGCRFDSGRLVSGQLRCKTLRGDTLAHLACPRQTRLYEFPCSKAKFENKAKNEVQNKKATFRLRIAHRNPQPQRGLRIFRSA